MPESIQGDGYNLLLVILDIHLLLCQDCISKMEWPGQKLNWLPEIIEEIVSEFDFNVGLKYFVYDGKKADISVVERIFKN